MTAGCFWLVSRQIDAKQVLSAVPRLDLRWVGFACLIVMLQIPLVGLRWRCILEALAVLDARMTHFAVMAITSIGVFFTQVLPSITGDGVRAWLLVRLGSNWRDAVTSVVIDRGVGAALLLAFGFVALLLPSGLTALGGYRDQVLVVYGALLAAGVLGLLLIPKFAPLMRRWRLSRWLAALAEDARRVLLGRKGGVVLGLGCLVHALTIVIVWLIARAQGLDLPVADAAVLFTVMVGVALVPISISGWGLRELAVVSLLGGHGVAPEQALLFSVCFGLVLAIGSLPGALAWLLYPLAPSRRRSWADVRYGRGAGRAADAPQPPGLRTLSMRIAMIGTGYVGLVSGACFSDFGHVVTCIDKDAGKIAQLCEGAIPIFEPGLGPLVASNVAAGRLCFTTEAAPALRAADAIFLAVGTPSRRGDGFADLSFVHDAARELAAELQGFTVIVIKSTVPVGTNDEVDSIVRELRPDADFAVVSNPEFLREGAAIEDFKRPDRVVVGTEDERARRVMRELYRPLFINETPILFTGRRAAELIKYASNAFLATKITFINEMADLCEKCGVDVQEVARGMGLDRRIAGKFLHRGTRLRRLVLPQGHRRAHGDRASPRGAGTDRRDCDRRERRPQEGHGGQDRRRLRRVGRRQDRGDPGAHVQAQHR